MSSFAREQDHPFEFSFCIASGKSLKISTFCRFNDRTTWAMAPPYSYKMQPQKWLKARPGHSWKQSLWQIHGIRNGLGDGASSVNVALNGCIKGWNSHGSDSWFQSEVCSKVVSTFPSLDFTLKLMIMSQHTMSSWIKWLATSKCRQIIFLHK